MIPPLEYQWIALTFDGEEIRQAVGTTEEKHIKDLDLSKVKRFALQNDKAQDMFGIDVEQRSFMIMGVPFHMDLLDKKYNPFFMRRNRHWSDGSFYRWYILGLQIEDPKGVKKRDRERYLYINPDASFTVTTKYV